MSRLYGDQLQASGKRYYFALDAAPGIITPSPATLTLFGRGPAAAQQVTVFRTPAPATLSLIGGALGAPVVLSPAPAALWLAGKQPGQVTSRTITPSLAPPVESPPVSFAPTLITIWTTQPGVAQVTLQTLEINVTQGGNIGFVSPAPAHLAMGALPFTLLYGEAGVGLLNVVGLQPTLLRELVVSPDVGSVAFTLASPILSLPFRWVDDTPAPAVTWITDAAA